jgi:hypothetical protein
MVRTFALGVAVLCACGAACAGTPPGKDLVEHFLSAAGIEEAFNGQIDAYTEMLGDKMPSAEKKRALEYMNATMGWNAIKEPYSTLVAKTYTAEELKAAIAYFETPLGVSANAKNRQFQHELVAALAKKSESVAKSYTPGASAKFDSGTASADEIVPTGVEEHVSDGQTYFTGALENRGKQATNHVQVEVNLFLAGKFVDQYSTYVSGSIAPGAPRYFKVSCGCKGSPPANHDTFKVNVIDGF